METFKFNLDWPHDVKYFRITKGAALLIGFSNSTKTFYWRAPSANDRRNGSLPLRDVHRSNLVAENLTLKAFRIVSKFVFEAILTNCSAVRIVVDSQSFKPVMSINPKRDERAEVTSVVPLDKVLPFGSWDVGDFKAFDAANQSAVSAQAEVFAYKSQEGHIHMFDKTGEKKTISASELKLELKGEIIDLAVSDYGDLGIFTDAGRLYTYAKSQGRVSPSVLFDASTECMQFSKRNDALVAVSKTEMRFFPKKRGHDFVLQGRDVATLRFEPGLDGKLLGLAVAPDFYSTCVVHSRAADSPLTVVVYHHVTDSSVVSHRPGPARAAPTRAASAPSKAAAAPASSPSAMVSRPAAGSPSSSAGLQATCSSAPADNGAYSYSDIASILSANTDVSATLVRKAVLALAESEAKDLRLVRATAGKDNAELELALLRQKHEDLQALLEQEKATSDRLQGEEKALTLKVADHEENIGKLEEGLKAIETELDARKTAEAAAKEEAARATAAKEGAERALAAERGEREEHEASRSGAAEANATKERAEKAIADLRAQLGQEKAQRDGLQGENEALKGKVTAHEAELDARKAAEAAAKQEAARATAAKEGAERALAAERELKEHGTAEEVAKEEAKKALAALREQHEEKLRKLVESLGLPADTSIDVFRSTFDELKTVKEAYYALLKTHDDFRGSVARGLGMSAAASLRDLCAKTEELRTLRGTAPGPRPPTPSARTHPHPRIHACVAHALCPVACVAHALSLQTARRVGLPAEATTDEVLAKAEELEALFNALKMRLSLSDEAPVSEILPVLEGLFEAIRLSLGLPAQYRVEQIHDKFVEIWDFFDATTQCMGLPANAEIDEVKAKVEELLALSGAMARRVGLPAEASIGEVLAKADEHVELFNAMMERLDLPPDASSMQEIRARVENHRANFGELAAGLFLPADASVAEICAKFEELWGFLDTTAEHMGLPAKATAQAICAKAEELWKLRRATVESLGLPSEASFQEICTKAEELAGLSPALDALKAEHKAMVDRADKALQAARVTIEAQAKAAKEQADAAAAEALKQIHDARSILSNSKKRKGPAGGAGGDGSQSASKRAAGGAAGSAPKPADGQENQPAPAGAAGGVKGSSELRPGGVLPLGAHNQPAAGQQ
eukprot:tig00000042_g15407.t1